MRIINKYEDGTKTKRVNYKKWYAQEKQKKGDKVRPLNEDVLTQFDDSLIARGFGEAQRRAMNATSHQEMGRKGAASRGIGGNGIMGLSEKRMPLKYLNDTGAQIHYIINDILNMNGDNWTDGGAGGPYIKNAKEGNGVYTFGKNSYDGHWLNNMPNGKGTLINEKCRIEGQFRFGKLVEIIGNKEGNEGVILNFSSIKSNEESGLFGSSRNSLPELNSTLIKDRKEMYKKFKTNKTHKKSKDKEHRKKGKSKSKSNKKKKEKNK